LTRWVFDLAYGFDVLGPGNTNNQIAELDPGQCGQQAPGDLVFYARAPPTRTTSVSTSAAAK